VYSSLFSLFNVKTRFSSRDYIEVLQKLAMECKVVSSQSSSEKYIQRKIIGNVDSSSSCGSSSSSSSSGDELIDIPLNDLRLDLAISLVTLLSSEVSINILNSQIIYLPDQMGYMLSSDKLINDDVPWLSGPEYISIRSGCRLIHRSISTLVAEKFGVKSLRLYLLSKNLEQNLFISNNSVTSKDNNNNEIESFGQAESLTNRLKTILDM